MIAGFERLVDHHDQQWSQELISRDPGADDRAVAASKRRIDALNSVRSGFVDDIDGWVERQLRMRGSAPLHTETLGSVIDRLAIAWVRSQRVTDTAINPDMVRRADRQWIQLLQAYDVLARELDAGRRRLPSWRTLKSYREVAAA